MLRLLPVAGAALALAAALPAAAAPSAARGKALVQRDCARCHAIGPTGASRDRKAPPFRLLSRRYDLDGLQEAFGEGVLVGHGGPEMPMFRFSPERVDDLIAYLRSVQVRRR